MRYFGLALAVTTASHRVCAESAAERSVNAEEIEFTDSEFLHVPAEEPIATAYETFMLAGISGSSGLVGGAQTKSGPHVVALMRLDGSERSFADRPFYWGTYQRIGFSMGVGYGYELSGNYETGPFMTTDSRGSGTFLSIGGRGEGRLIARTPFVRFFGHLAWGYSMQLSAGRLELAILPSLGAVSAGKSPVQYSGHTWLRERFTARFWRILLEVEHGQTVPNAAGKYWEGSLCAAAETLPVGSCTSVFVLDLYSHPRVSISEVRLSLGIGGIFAGTRAHR